MKGDPYFTTAKFPSTCPETGKPIKKGDPIAYFPRERKAFHNDSRSADQVRDLNFSRSFGMADQDW